MAKIVNKFNQHRVLKNIGTIDFWYYLLYVYRYVYIGLVFVIKRR